MDNNQGVMIAIRHSKLPRKITHKPAELKTIHHLKADDKPAEVKARLEVHARKLIRKFCAIDHRAKRLFRAMPHEVNRIISDTGRCEQALQFWMRDVTATATQIVEKFNELQQDQIALRTRLACVSSSYSTHKIMFTHIRSNDHVHIGTT